MFEGKLGDLARAVDVQRQLLAAAGAGAESRPVALGAARKLTELLAAEGLAVVSGATRSRPSRRSIPIRRAGAP